MASKKPVSASKKAKTVATYHPNDMKAILKRIGGSQHDDWNTILVDQALSILWLAQSKDQTRDRQYSATLGALVGIAPQDELESMIAVQLLAAHNAAIECYRRAMTGGQTIEGRRETLNQAKQALPHIRVTAQGSQSPSRQGPAEGDSRARSCARRSAGGSRNREDPGGREIRGSTPCKANCPCTRAGDAVPGRGPGAGAGRRPCRTVAAGCTAGRLREHQRVTRTLSSMVDTPPNRFRSDGRLRRCYGP
jgi:hypothetical protein